MKYINNKKYLSNIIIIFFIIFFIIFLFIFYKFFYNKFFYIYDRRVNKKKLRLVQYNVEWLFLDKLHKGKCPGKKCIWKSEKDMFLHLEFISNIIKKLNPDIINLCEIKNYNSIHGILNFINNFYNNSYKGYFAENKKNLEGLNVGLISKIDPICLYRTNLKSTYPIKNSKCNFKHKNINTDLEKHYIAEFYINNINIVLIGVHLKAFFYAESCAKKEAQALIIHNIILNYKNNIYYKDKNYEFIIIGDFNDFDNDTLDINNNKSNSLVFDILEKESNLYNLAAEIKKKNRYSEKYDKPNDNSNNIKFSLLDYCLVSHNLINKVSDIFVYKDFNIWDKYNSDHLPLVIDFKF
jgi:exonuclease III